MYVALNVITDEMITVKQVEILRVGDDRSDNRRVTVMDALRHESEVLKVLDHPNVVQYLGFEETPRHLNMLVLVSDHHWHTADRGFLASLNTFRAVRSTVY